MDTTTIIASSKKFKNVEDLYLNFDLISDLLKEDIQKICVAKSLYFADFEASFKVALSQTKKTLVKKNLRGVKRFFSCTNLKDALKWLQSRILNNMLNATCTKHKFAFKPPKIRDFEDYNISKDYDLDEEILLEDLKKIDKETLKKNLKKVWDEAKFDEDFDMQDLKDLCKKYKIDLYEVVTKEELETPNLGLIEQNGLKQSYLIF